jgi:hypothetical protein
VALPIELAGDFERLNADVLREVFYREYDPADDAHGGAEECRGVRGPARVMEEAGRIVTRAPWTLTGLTARPVLRSLVVDGDETWVVEQVTPDPAGGTVWLIESHKA